MVEAVVAVVARLVQAGLETAAVAPRAAAMAVQEVQVTAEPAAQVEPLQSIQVRVILVEMVPNGTRHMVLAVAVGVARKLPAAQGEVMAAQVEAAQMVAQVALVPKALSSLRIRRLDQQKSTSPPAPHGPCRAIGIMQTTLLKLSVAVGVVPQV